MSAKELSAGLLIIVLIAFGITVNYADARIKKLESHNNTLIKEIQQVREELFLARQAHKWVPVITKLITPLGELELNVLAETLKQMEERDVSKNPIVLRGN